MFCIDRSGSGNVSQTLNDSLSYDNNDNDSAASATQTRCDLCNQCLDDKAALLHLKDEQHSTASSYLRDDEKRKQLLHRAETHVNELFVSESSMLCICAFCKKTPCLSVRPFHIYSHCVNTHLSKDLSGCCLIYTRSGEPEHLQVSADLISQCYDDNTYPCHRCVETFTSPSAAINHMSEAGHELLPKFWNSGTDPQDVAIAICAACTQGDIILTTPRLLLIHLIKVHGGLIKRTQSGDNVSFTVIRYRYLQCSSIPEFLSNSHKKTTLDKVLATFNEWLKENKNYVKALQSSPPSQSSDAEPGSKRLSEDVSLTLKSRLCQQYCCDCCRVTLGTDKKSALAHMAALGHPSISMYNTRIHPISQDCELVSVHSYGVYQDFTHNFSSLLFRCTIGGCTFVAPDPIVCSVHLETMHHKEPGPLTVSLFRKMMTQTYDLSCGEGGSVSCPTCHCLFTSVPELTNHMAGTKHQAMLERANHLFDIARCLQCRHDNPKAVFIREAALIDHMVKHGKQSQHTALQFTVTSFRRDVNSTMALTEYDTPWLKDQVTVGCLKQLVNGSHTSKLERKRYRSIIDKIKGPQSATL